MAQAILSAMVAMRSGVRTVPQRPRWLIGLGLLFMFRERCVGWLLVLSVEFWRPIWTQKTQRAGQGVLGKGCERAENQKNIPQIIC